ncbi:MAG: hypothetical protein M1835_000311 [Candelina submexicana]|nr:MAG: hypothetical protein M1835_000311 [Candelina submexicana]
MGGQYTFQGGDTASTEQHIYWLDLTKSFSVGGVLSSNSLNSTQAPDDSGWQATGAFFTSKSTLYSFGTPSNSIARDSLSTYDTALNQWGTARVAEGSLNVGARHMNMHATGGPGSGFITGGGDADPKGMIQFNASDPSRLSWVNHTGENVPNTMGATMQYIRMGREGVLIALGGYDTTVPLVDLAGRYYPTRSMNSIMVYDIGTSTWQACFLTRYNVIATGTIPSDRSEFCAAVSASPDDSSFQLTIYGGWSLDRGKAFTDVYVLTIPSFRWTQISTKNDVEATLPGITGRKSMTCEIYNGRTMIVVRGDVRMGDTQTNGKSCNNSYPPIRVLDTTAFEWLDHFTPSRTAYSVPEAVYNVIGGGPSGGATTMSPQSGFNAPLQSIFSRTLPRPSTPITSFPSGPSQSSKPSANRKGRVVGAVIGSIIALSLLGTLIFFWTGARRRRRPVVPEKTMSNEVGGQEWQKPELPNVENEVKRGEVKNVVGPLELDAGYGDAEMRSRVEMF